MVSGLVVGGPSSGSPVAQVNVGNNVPDYNPDPKPNEVGKTAMCLEDQLRGLAARYEIAAFYAFGSRAQEVASRVRGQAVPPHFPESDVDIGVQPVPGRRLTVRDRVRVSVELEDLLAAKRVDLVVLAEADPFLALDVIRGELLYCADADSQAEDELYILRRAGDLAHYARERWQQILTRPTT